MKKILTVVILSAISFGVSALGSLEAATPTRYTGWACDPSSAGFQTPVHVWRDDGVFLGGIVATAQREPAVGTICNSPHAAHGFTLSLSEDSPLMDNKWHTVTVYSFNADGSTVQLSGSPVSLYFKGKQPEVVAPSMMGDIVGRDLQIPGASWLGHVGIWDGAQVVEVLNEGGNVVKYNSFDNFKSRTVPWNSLSPNIPPYLEVKTCYSTRCDIEISRPEYVTLGARRAIANRAYQIGLIGADYTLTAIPTKAVPSIISYNDNWSRPAVRGLYRCDTFITDAYTVTGPSYSYNGSLPKIVTGAPSDWETKLSNMGRAITPQQLYAYFRDAPF